MTRSAAAVPLAVALLAARGGHAVVRRAEARTSGGVPDGVLITDDAAGRIWRVVCCGR